MTEITDVPSPFCGIGTDDLTIEVDGTQLKIKTNGCAINTPAFEQKIQDAKPTIAGKEVTLKEAVTRAADLLRTSNQPVIGGCASDVNGMRALISLADRNGAVVDNMSFIAGKRNFLAMQDSGWMNTTLAEIKNRCDFLLVVGVDLEAFAPRFFQRYLWNDSAMFLSDTSNRKIVFLGKKTSGKASVSPKGKKPKVLECSNDDLPEVLIALKALVKGKLPDIKKIGNIKIKELHTLANQLKKASYGVVTWSSSAMDFPHAELTVQTLCEMVKDVNDSGNRCSGFPLGGKEGDQTANQVCGWQTGYPARMRFSSSFPEYDPFLYDSQKMLDNGEADVLVWVQAFNSNAVPPQVSIPLIVIARSGMQFDKEPDVFIPVGTPGIDHVGHVYRLDSVVAIRLKKLRETGLPSTSEVLSAIEQKL